MPETADEIRAMLAIGRIITEHARMEQTLATQTHYLLMHRRETDHHFSRRAQVEQLTQEMDSSRNADRKCAGTFQRAALSIADEEWLRKRVQQAVTESTRLSAIRHDIAHGFSNLSGPPGDPVTTVRCMLWEREQLTGSRRAWAAALGSGKEKTFVERKYTLDQLERIVDEIRSATSEIGLLGSSLSSKEFHKVIDDRGH